ncbi:MAG: YCF48-related protein [Nevskia sp.]
MKALSGLLAALALASASAVVATHAQDAAGDAAPAAAAPAAPSFKPRPAEIAPLAVRNLMLDVANTGKRLIAVGDHGHILASNDGKNWAQVPVPVRAPLTAVSFPDENNGWAVGHDAVIVHSSDGGRTWVLQMFEPALEKPFLDVLFLDAQKGFAVGAYGLFYKTEDGGADWTEVDAPEVRTDELHLYSIAKLGNGSLFVSGEQGMLAVSTDGGLHWKKVTSPYEATLFGIVPHGDKGAVICGLRGNAFVADDVGSGPWKRIETGTKASFFGCAAIDDSHVALVGLSGTVLVADLGTATTVRLKSPVESAFSGVVKWGSGLVLTGEQGIQQISVAQ